MSATWLALFIVITVVSGFVILLSVSMITQAWAKKGNDPRSDDELLRDVQRAMREQGRQ